jgi:glycosyltransferase involved in cell wall biosynthesis
MSGRTPGESLCPSAGSLDRLIRRAYKARRRGNCGDHGQPIEAGAKSQHRPFTGEWPKPVGVFAKKSRIWLIISRMDLSPLISIVMPSFQQAVFIEEAVRSVLDQQGVEAELLVMDPGSTDGSRELLQSLKKEYGERLSLHFGPDQGQSDAINRGMALARGKILGWLNSDDRLRPDALRRIVPLLSSDGPRWVYGRCGIIDEKGRQIWRGIVWYKNLRGRRFSMFKLLTEDFIPQMATFWNRPLWEAAGGLDKNRHLDMDYDLFLRFARVESPTVLTEYLADFRVHWGAKGSRRMVEHLCEAKLTAQRHAASLGLRGRLAFMLHRIYGIRTRIIYHLIKP